MHREFRKRLTNAEGVSQFVLAIFADIRGFSAFSQNTESPDAAMYIKRVYTRLLDDYFPEASFYKPTGDGLMVIIPYGEQTLAQVSGDAVTAAMACINDFPEICKDDPMINFETPKHLGIGIARGTASRIFSGSKTLDYSGRLLNLSARLMALARPYGIVIDGEFKLDMIPAAERPKFKEHKVFLRGISERDSRLIYVLDTVTDIPKENLAPFGEPKWQRVEQVKTLAAWKELGRTFRLYLLGPPETEAEILVQVGHPLHRNGKVVEGHKTVRNLKSGPHFKYLREAETHFVKLDLKEIVPLMDAEQLTDDSPITISAAYPERST